MKVLLTSGGAMAQKIANLIKADMCSVRLLTDQQIAEVLGRYDVIIHTAANIKCETLQTAITDNFILTKRVLDTLYTNNKDATFIYISSMSMLQSATEYLPVSSMSTYAFSKYLAEQYCIRHPLQNLLCVRFSTIFYENASKDGLSALVTNAVLQKKITIYNDGEARRDFIPLEKGMQKLISLIPAIGKDGCRITNIASGRSYSFKEVAEILKKNIPGLEVENKDVGPGSEILSEFPVSGNNPEPFFIDNYIFNFIEKLKSSASNNLQ